MGVAILIGLVLIVAAVIVTISAFLIYGMYLGIGRVARASHKLWRQIATGYRGA
jgi:hypothetical protein